MLARSTAMLVCSAWTLATVGCHRNGADDSGDAAPDGASSTDADQGDTDLSADGNESQEGGESVATCLEVLGPDHTFPVAHGEPGTQIHAAAAFDGQALWVTYNIPEAGDTGLFDVWAIRLACDGSVLTAPMHVNTTVAPNDVNPCLASSDDTVLIVWESDTGMGIYNMQTSYRLFRRDGTPIMDEDRMLSLTRDGAPFEGNVFMTTVAALPDGEYAIAGARGVAEANAFQSYVQVLDSNGEVDGEATDGYFQEAVQQTYPSLAAAADGELHLAWTSDAGDGESAVYKPVDDGSTAPETVWAGDGTSSGTALAVDPDEPDRILMAFHAGTTSANIVLTDVGQPPGDRPELDLGQAGRIDHSPNIALGPGGGALVWYRVISGIRNEVVVQGFRWDGNDLTPDVELVIPTVDPAAPYQAAITHVDGDVYFVAWSEGTSPDFTIQGQFITVR